MTDEQATRHRTEQHHSEHWRLTQVVKDRLTSPAWLARTAGVCLSGVSVGFVVLLAFILETRGDIALITRPLPMQIALALPTVVAVLTAVTAVGTVLAWWNRYWSLRARLHQTLVTVLGLGFSWILATLGFLPL
ncbi:hypothetical protein [Haloarcula onubensis]|uniref:Uncharacterized protein n=1 Tax=Haloarcula onubensis TaxID=2950539 RepID=A0ABU2FSG3_9EURY|nr:hypothetical protein [Halomicroarcula sp. S3CR25-11]MDS0283698.1 hypothetical protein [Halomicroarcula sp. S3CR25-11]